MNTNKLSQVLPTNSRQKKNSEDIGKSSKQDSLKSSISALPGLQQKKKPEQKLKPEQKSERRQQQQRSRSARRQEKKKKTEILLNIIIPDFTRKDRNERNQLHRQCLEQKLINIKEIINQFKTMRQDPKIFSQFINQEDKYGFTPLLLCCIQQDKIKHREDQDNNAKLLNIELSRTSSLTKLNQREDNNKVLCIEFLISNGAKINVQNNRTLWNPFHWCSFYGDAESLTVLISAEKQQTAESCNQFRLIYESHLQKNQQLKKKQDLPQSKALKYIRFELYNIQSLLPDHEGQFPIDLAGDRNHKEAVIQLLNRLQNHINNFHKYQLQTNRSSKSKKPKESAQAKMMESKQKYLTNEKEEAEIEEEMLYSQNQQKHIFNPILLIHTVFQSIQYQDKRVNDAIKQICKMVDNFCIFIFAPIPEKHFQSILHQAAKYNNVELLDFFNFQLQQLLDDVVDRRNTKLIEQIQESAHQTKFNIKHNNILCLNDFEITLFKSSFRKVIKHYSNYYERFLKLLESENVVQGSDVENQNKQKHQTNSLNRLINKIYDRYINITDYYGNTPLHLATINSNQESIRYLINHNGNLYIENQEGFTSRQLLNESQILDKIINLQGSSKQLQSIQNEYEKRLTKYLSRTIKLGNIINKDNLNSLIEYTEKLKIPDFVMKFKFKTLRLPSQSHELSEKYDYAKMQYQNSYIFVSRIELDNLNKFINKLIKTKLTIQLMNSIEPGVYYILFSASQALLQFDCKMQQKRMKLIDSYDLEQYDYNLKEKFEPFRSRQRQDIIVDKIKQYFNLDDLISQKTIDTYYRMHTFGGVSKIKQIWLESGKWYWPQPLLQFRDYLKENINQNFYSITLLKQYFGEKIAFFFAWKSFITCTLLFIAIPGVIIQVYIILKNDFHHWIIPFWVFYVTIWNTFTVEFWKRKSCEINYRWGQLELMNNPEELQKEIKEDFVGDDEIQSNTGELTKHYTQFRTIIVMLISIPIFLGLICCVGITFVGVQYYKDTYAKNSTVLSTLAGVIQGVTIVILNKIYAKMTELFTKWENHKYKDQAETSIISKSILFKLINSYFSIVYVTFFQSNSTFETIFYLLVPILLVNQITYIALSILLPLFKYKNQEKSYFTSVKNMYRKFEANFSSKFSFLTNAASQQIKQDQIEQFWKLQFKKEMENAKRCIIQFDVSTTKECQEVNRISHVDVDSVELNSQKLENLDIVMYYSDGITELGYITLFAAAFPIGPLISLIASCIEIKSKLYAHLYIFRRPDCHRGVGIGKWIDVWELITLASIFSNFAMLYFHKTSLVEMFYREDYEETNKIWFFMIVITILIFIRYFFQEVIIDKPKWVQQQEKFKQYQLQRRQQEEEKILELTKDKQKELEKDIQFKVKEISEKHKEKIQDLEKQLQVKVKSCNSIKANVNPKYHREKSSLSGALSKKESIYQQMELQSSKALTKKQTWNKQQVEDLYFFSIIKNTFVNFERELLIDRLRQIQSSIEQRIVLCSTCNSCICIIECLDCQIEFCSKCFHQSHQYLETGKIKTKHSIRIIRSNEQFKHLMSQIAQYQVLKITRRLSPLRIEDENANQSDLVQSQFVADEQSLKRLKKLQYFCFPTKSSMESYAKLQQLFQIFLEEFMTNNGFSEDKKLDDHKIFRLFVYKDVTIRKESRAFDDIMDMEEFNTEDKLFLNRLVFLAIKKHGIATTFEDFNKILLAFMHSTIEKKMLLLIDMIDEDSDQNLSNVELKNVLTPSFLQTLGTNNIKISDIIELLFRDTQSQDQEKAAKNPKLSAGQNQQNSYGLKFITKQYLIRQLFEMFQTSTTGYEKVFRELVQDQSEPGDLEAKVN